MRQYYVAMGSMDVKLATLTDLLQAFCANKKRQLAVCCQARDTLDDVICGVAATQQHQIVTLFSDMSHEEKQGAIEQFRCQSMSLDAATGSENPPGGVVLIATDAALADLDRPIELEIVINYDLPTSEERMIRRFGAFFGPRQDNPKMVVVNFIVAGMIEKFRNYEKMCEDDIEVMPLHVADIFSEVRKF